MHPDIKVKIITKLNPGVKSVNLSVKVEQKFKNVNWLSYQGEGDNKLKSWSRSRKYDMSTRPNCKNNKIERLTCKVSIDFANQFFF